MHCEPPIEARIIDEALTILGPNGEKWIQCEEADSSRNHWPPLRPGARGFPDGKVRGSAPRPA